MILVDPLTEFPMFGPPLADARMEFLAPRNADWGGICSHRNVIRVQSAFAKTSLRSTITGSSLG